MPGPMPPQGGQPPQPSQGQPSQGGGLANLLKSLDQGIDAIAQAISSDKSAPPQAVKLIQGIDQQFGQFMDMVVGGAGGDDQPADDSGAQGQTVPPEAGGNKGAVPAP